MNRFEQIFAGAAREALQRKSLAQIAAADFEIGRHRRFKSYPPDGDGSYGTTVTDELSREQAARRARGEVDDEPDSANDDAEPEILDRPRILRWLLHSPHGAALLRRSNTSPDELADLLVESSREQSKKRQLRNTGMNHLSDDFIEVAKAAVTRGHTNFTREDFYKAVELRAQLDQRHGESAAQAFARIAQSGEGEVLMRAMRHAADVPGSVSKADTGAYDQLMQKAEALAKRDGITREQAFARLYTAPENRALAVAERASAHAKSQEAISKILG